jgi:hypothetical protein
MHPEVSKAVLSRYRYSADFRGFLSVETQDPETSQLAASEGAVRPVFREHAQVPTCVAPRTTYTDISACKI